MLGSPPFGGDGATSSSAMQPFGAGRSRPTSPDRSEPPFRPPPPPFDPPAGGSLFDDPPAPMGSGFNPPGMGLPEGGPSGSLFDPSERSFLSSFLEGFQDWEFDPSLPKDMPSFKDASMRAGLSDGSNSPANGFRKPPNRRGPSNSGSTGWSPHNGNAGTGQTPPALEIVTSRNGDPNASNPARASAVFGGLSGWSDEEDVSTTPTGTTAEDEGAVGRKRSASTANRGNNPTQADTPESVRSNDTNDSRGHSAYNAFIISYAPHPSSSHNQLPSPHHNQQPFRPPLPSYASRLPNHGQPPLQPQNGYPHIQPQPQLHSHMSLGLYGSNNQPGFQIDGGMNSGKKLKTGHQTSAPGSGSSQSPSQNDPQFNHSRSDSANGNSKPAVQRQLLTDSEKRQNHILSEQRRRNFIREGFKELVELLEAGRGFGARGLGLSSGDGTGVEDEGLDDRSDPSDNEDGTSSKKKKKSKRATPAGRRGRGKGRGRGGSAGGGGGSKSAVLFQAVDLIRWLEVKNSELEANCEELESWNGSNDATMQEG